MLRTSLPYLHCRHILHVLRTDEIFSLLSKPFFQPIRSILPPETWKEYCQEIKNPIDLILIEKKLSPPPSTSTSPSLYSSHTDFFSDLRLPFSNCIQFWELDDFSVANAATYLLSEVGMMEKEVSFAVKRGKKEKWIPNEEEGRKALEEDDENEYQLSLSDYTDLCTLLSYCFHDTSYPFSTFHFPILAYAGDPIENYYFITKKPMDFTTIKRNLYTLSYRSKSDMMSDVMLIFDNCENYYKDNGHKLPKWQNVVREAGKCREGVKKKWKEIEGKREREGEGEGEKKGKSKSNGGGSGSGGKNHQSSRDTSPSASVSHSSPSTSSSSSSSSSSLFSLPLPPLPISFPLLLSFTSSLISSLRDEISVFQHRVTDAIAPNYSQIITHPMCVDDISMKIKKKIYGQNGHNGYREYLEDWQKIFDNCRKYNGIQSEISLLADTVEAKVKAKWMKEMGNNEKEKERGSGGKKEKEKERELEKEKVKETHGNGNNSKPQPLPLPPPPPPPLPPSSSSSSSAPLPPSAAPLTFKLKLKFGSESKVIDIGDPPSSTQNQTKQTTLPPPPPPPTSSSSSSSSSSSPPPSKVIKPSPFVSPPPAVSPPPPPPPSSLSSSSSSSPSSSSSSHSFPIPNAQKSAAFYGPANSVSTIPSASSASSSSSTVTPPPLPLSSFPWSTRTPITIHLTSPFLYDYIPPSRVPSPLPSLLRRLVDDIKRLDTSTLNIFSVTIDQLIYLSNYTNIISRPIDFATIDSGLSKQLYKVVSDVVNDIDLIFTNCITYWASQGEVGTQYVQHAEMMIYSSRRRMMEILDSEERKRDRFRDHQHLHGIELMVCNNLYMEMQMFEKSNEFTIFSMNIHDCFPDDSALKSYTDMIPHPMDWPTICKKLSSSPPSYRHYEEMLSDCRLIFTNCIAFNGDQDGYGVAAQYCLNELNILIREYEFALSNWMDTRIYNKQIAVRRVKEEEDRRSVQIMMEAQSSNNIISNGNSESKDKDNDIIMAVSSSSSSSSSPSSSLPALSSLPSLLRTESISTFLPTTPMSPLNPNYPNYTYMEKNISMTSQGNGNANGNGNSSIRPSAVPLTPHYPSTLTGSRVILSDPSNSKLSHYLTSTPNPTHPLPPIHLTPSSFSRCDTQINYVIGSSNIFGLFLYPVNFYNYPSMFDYYTIVQNPMDFQRITRSFHTLFYQSEEEFLRDCRLVFDNAIKYHGSEERKSDPNVSAMSYEVTQKARNARRAFEEEWNSAMSRGQKKGGNGIGNGNGISSGMKKSKGKKSRDQEMEIDIGGPTEISLHSSSASSPSPMLSSSLTTSPSKPRPQPHPATVTPVVSHKPPSTSTSTTLEGKRDQFCLPSSSSNLVTLPPFPYPLPPSTPLPIPSIQSIEFNPHVDKFLRIVLPNPLEDKRITSELLRQEEEGRRGGRRRGENDVDNNNDPIHPVDVIDKMMGIVCDDVYRNRKWFPGIEKEKEVMDMVKREVAVESKGKADNGTKNEKESASSPSHYLPQFLPTEEDCDRLSDLFSHLQHQQDDLYAQYAHLEYDNEEKDEEDDQEEEGENEYDGEEEDGDHDDDNDNDIDGMRGLMDMSDSASSSSSSSSSSSLPSSALFSLSSASHSLSHPPPYRADVRRFPSIPSTSSFLITLPSLFSSRSSSSPSLQDFYHCGFHPFSSSLLLHVTHRVIEAVHPSYPINLDHFTLRVSFRSGSTHSAHSPAQSFSLFLRSSPSLLPLDSLPPLTVDHLYSVAHKISQGERYGPSIILTDNEKEQLSVYIREKWKDIKRKRLNSAKERRIREKREKEKEREREMIRREKEEKERLEILRAFNSSINGNQHSSASMELSTSSSSSSLFPSTSAPVPAVPFRLFPVSSAQLDGEVIDRRTVRGRGKGKDQQIIQYIPIESDDSLVPSQWMNDRETVNRIFPPLSAETMEIFRSLITLSSASSSSSSFLSPSLLPLLHDYTKSFTYDSYAGCFLSLSPPSVSSSLPLPFPTIEIDILSPCGHLGVEVEGRRLVSEGRRVEWLKREEAEGKGEKKVKKKKGGEREREKENGEEKERVTEKEKENVPGHVQWTPKVFEREKEKDLIFVKDEFVSEPILEDSTQFFKKAKRESQS